MILESLIFDLGDTGKGLSAKGACPDVVVCVDASDTKRQYLAERCNVLSG